MMIDNESTTPSRKDKTTRQPDRGDLLSPADERYCEIIIKGHLEEHWADWLGGLHIQHEEGGNTLLSGAIPDQAALHGILAYIRDLGLTLISLNQYDNGENK